MEERRYMEETSIIKFVAESYVGVGGNPIVLFTESAEWLYNCYEKTGDCVCLRAAKQIVRAYMELGLLYESAEGIFEKILKAAGTSFEEEFPKCIYTQNTLKWKVTQIREVLGFWPYTSENKYSANQVAQDILDKVNNNEYGCFYYGKKENEVMYELLILREDAYLMDLEKKRIYVFEQ